MSERELPILGGFRAVYGADAEAFLAACEAEPPIGYTKACSGGWVGSADLFIDYFVGSPDATPTDPPTPAQQKPAE